MEGVDAVRPGRCFVQMMLSHCPVHVSFEELVQGVFLCVTDDGAQVFDLDPTSRVILDLEVGCVLEMGRGVSV
jgi:hypothetical protein